MTDFVPLITMTAMIWAVINFLKYARNADWNGALTQLAVWAAGVGVVVLFAHSDWAASIPVGDLSLDQLNGWSLVIAGFAAGSAASTGFDIKKAVDHSDTAHVPSLIKKDDV